MVRFFFSLLLCIPFHHVPKAERKKILFNVSGCNIVRASVCVCALCVRACPMMKPVGPTHSPIQFHHYYFYDYYRKIHWRKLAEQHVSYQMTATFTGRISFDTSTFSSFFFRRIFNLFYLQIFPQCLCFHFFVEITFLCGVYERTEHGWKKSILI